MSFRLLLWLAMAAMFAGCFGPPQFHMFVFNETTEEVAVRVRIFPEGSAEDVFHQEVRLPPSNRTNLRENREVDLGEVTLSPGTQYVVNATTDKFWLEETHKFGDSITSFKIHVAAGRFYFTQGSRDL